MQNDIIIKNKLIREEFCSIEEAKANLRITGNEDNQLVRDKLAAAIEFAEKFMRIHINKREISMVISEIEANKIRLPFIPVFRVTKISLAKEEKELELGKDFYVQDDCLNFITCIKNKGIRIEYISGFDEVPPLIKQGLFMHLDFLYDKENLQTANMQSLLMNYVPYRRIKL